jgi:hypothetical protein
MSNSWIWLETTLSKLPHQTRTHHQPLTIFGPSIAGVRGKSACCKPEQVEAELGRIPYDFNCLHRFVVMTADVMFVNCIAFLTTLSWKLRLATIEHLPLHTATQLSNSLLKIVRLYACTGFIVRIIVMDQEFNKVKDTCEMVKLNTTAARKHIGEIKCYIQTIKECSCALVLDLPYTKLLRQVDIHLIYFAVLWLNSLPAAAGVSDKYSPLKIVLGPKLDFKKHCKAIFGSYIKAHDDTTITNTMRPCTFPGIFLGPTGNCQDTHKVFNINTGVIKKNPTITPLPMPDRFIKVIKDWGRRHQNKDKAKSLEFLICKWQRYNWENNNLQDVEGHVKSDITHPNVPAQFRGVDLEQEQPHHHHVVEIINDSKHECIYAAQCNSSLDDLPHKTAGVSTAIDKVNAFKFSEDDPDPFHKLDTPPTLDG